MIFNDITELTIYQVETIKPLLQEALANETSPLVLDFTPINKIDMVGIQLLLSSLQTAKTLDKKIEFININNDLLDQIVTTHCEKALGLSHG